MEATKEGEEVGEGVRGGRGGTRGESIQSAHNSFVTLL